MKQQWKEQINDHDIPIVPDLLVDIKRTRNLGNAVSAEVVAKIDRWNDELVVKATEHGTEHPIVLTGLYDLVNFYTEAHQYYIAERLLKRLQTAYKRTFKSPHPAIAKSLTRLGDVLNQQIKYKESESYYLESLAQYNQLIDIQNDLSIAPTLQGLAISYAQQRRFENSEQYYQRLLLLYRKFHNEEHPKILEVISELTVVLEALGRYQEAEDLCGSSLQNCITILGEDHPVTQNASAALARVKLNNGHKEEAEQMYRQAIRYSVLGLGEEHDQTIALKYSLTQLLIQKKEYQESEQILHQVIRAQEKNKGIYDKDTLGMYQYIGELYLLRLEVLPARDYFTRAYEGRRQVEGVEHPLTYASFFAIGKSYHLECYWRNQLNYSDNVQKAQEIFDQVFHGLYQLLGLSYPLTMEVALYYGEFLLSHDQFSVAEKVYRLLSDFYQGYLNPEEVIRSLKPSSSSFLRSSASPSRASTREAQQRQKPKVLTLAEILQFAEINYHLGVISEKLKKLNFAMLTFEKSYYLYLYAEKEYEKLYPSQVEMSTPRSRMDEKSQQTDEKKDPSTLLHYEDEQEVLRKKQYETIQTMKKESLEQYKHTEYINNL